MATDATKWGEADLCLYARLLRVNREQLIHHEARLFPDRDRYFSEIERGVDVFLDPDTGIGTGSPIEKYVKPRDLATLLNPASGRVVAVYQHVRAKRTCERVDGCLAAIREQMGAVGWCSYESPTVAMLFLSGDDARTSGIAQAFEKLLGRHAERRVRCGPNR
jgi:hypothetical protein